MTHATEKTEQVGESAALYAIVIDCNEWIRLKWLGSPIGLTFLALMKRDPRLHLAIPEVLNTELDKHRAISARTALQNLNNAIAEVSTLMGERTARSMATVTEESIEVGMRQRLSSIVDQALYPPMDLEEVRRALERVNAETAPNAHKNQQMKDSLLWEACVSLAADRQVIFVTSDRAFYREKDTKKGLASNLTQEPVVQSGRLLAFPSLEEAMRSFAPEVSVDASEFERADVRKLIGRYASDAFRRSPVAQEILWHATLRDVVPKYFRTDVAHLFAASFTCHFGITTNASLLHGEAAVSGECKVNTRTATVQDLTLSDIHWKLRNSNGNEIASTEYLPRDLMTNLDRIPNGM